MPRIVVNAVGANLVSHASNGVQPVVFTQAQNPDKSAVKDTRT